MKTEFYKKNKDVKPSDLVLHANSRSCFFRYQHKELEMGKQSWEQGYDSPEDAEENGSTVLDGKSACFNPLQLFEQYSDQFDDDYVVCVLRGTSVGTGHDGECVVDVENVVCVYDKKEFESFIANNHIVDKTLWGEPILEWATLKLWEEM